MNDRLDERDGAALAPQRGGASARDERAGRLGVWLGWLGRAQARHPRSFLWLGLLVSVVAALMCLRLTLRTRFEDLLPEQSPSVIELRRLLGETERGGQVFVLLEGPEREALREAADAVAADLRGLHAPEIVGAASGVHEARRFLLPRAGLFAGVQALRRADAALRERLAYEVGEALGTNLLDAPPDASLEAALSEALGGSSLAALGERFPDGYYEDAAGNALVVVVRTSVPSDDLGRARAVYERVQQRVAQTIASYPSLRASFAGDLVTSLAEYGATQRDLLDVGALGLTLVLGVVLLYFMRPRVLLLMAMAIVAGLSWTFACASVWFGHLNLASGSLISLVTGSSINHGIIFMARYFEERRSGHSPAAAVELSHAGTGTATLTAALAGAAAYACLGSGDFPLLDHFAGVGAIGMFLCWLSTLLLLGPGLICLERWRPLPSAPSGRLSRFRVRYEQPFAYLVSRFARPIALGGGALAVVGVVASVHYARVWPTEWDMRRLQNDLGDASELYATSHRCAEILGAAIESSMLVLAERADQVPALKQVLEARRDAAPADDKPFEAVHTLFDFVPDEQPEKLALLASIRATLSRLEAHAQGEQRQRIAALMPAADLAPFGIDDLPAELAAPFSDKHGGRGRVALIEPTRGRSDSDLRYLVHWANAFRETRLPSGEVVRGSGRAVVFADMLQTVQTATPRMLGLSLCMTTLVVAVLVRGLRSTLLVFAALSTGLTWLGLFMSLGDVRLNFLNFIALPVTFGIAVDYPVNFLMRLRSEPERGVLGALRGTGGAIILCSLTTQLGYLALLGSINQAIRSLGVLCMLGELACVTAATLLLPALLEWRGSRRPAATQLSPPLPEAKGAQLRAR
ncbi:MAG TPA: MMPL family transporter [Polyangiaceae bacterium]|nr:MMPL family transporter [Polyangiaceae bacterium]